eukprot:scaffold21510_cov111-Isochrysis_galbana.AAC.7
MAPRQLLLELEEVDMAADKGSKRVRVDRADESSTQVPPRKGDYRVGARTTTNTCKAIMTDPPIDDTQAQEPDAPGTHDAKQRAPVHGHTGDPPPDKALSDILVGSCQECRGLRGGGAMGG